jgi:hypothetical protein
MPRFLPLTLILAGCAAAPTADLPPPDLLPTDQVLAAAGTDRIAAGDDAALAARAAALQARGRQLAATPVTGPPVP